MAVWSRYVCAYLAIGFVLFWNVFIWQFEVRAGEWVLISEPYLGMGESSWYFTSRDENLLHIVYVRESQRGNKAEIERVEKERERERERGVSSSGCDFISRVSRSFVSQQSIYLQRSAVWNSNIILKLIRFNRRLCEWSCTPYKIHRLYIYIALQI